MSATDIPAAPSATPEEHGLTLVMPGRRVPAGRGMSWIGEGWRLFTRAPLMWIIACVVLFIVMVVMNLVPILGGLVFQLLQTVFWAGLIGACRSLETGGEFEIENLFGGFKHRFGPLLVLSLIFVLAGLVIAVVYFGFVGFSVMSAMWSGDQEAVAAALISSIGMMLLGSLVALLLVVPLMAAMWFAPALVYMHGMGPMEALKASFGASLRNFIPFFVYGIVMLLLAILAAIPFGLGMLVYVPLMITSAYASYRDIFTDEAAAAVATPRDPFAARA